MKIEVESEALDSIKRMAQQLQDERDELLACLAWYVKEDDTCETMSGNEYWLEGLNRARAIIAKCTSSPKVME